MNIIQVTTIVQVVVPGMLYEYAINIFQGAMLTLVTGMAISF